MAKLSFLLLLVGLAVPTGHGADVRAPDLGQVVSVDKSWGQKPLHGHPTSIFMYNFLDARDDDYTLTLDVFVEVAADFPRIDSAEVEVEVLDEQGQKIEVRAKLKQFEPSHKSQVGVYDLRMKRGQKIGTIKVRWKGSEQIYPMSQAETSEETINT